jgi:serine/threonine protein phosphatase PrpC
MTGGVQTAQWRVMGRSVRGMSHRRRNQANQDAIQWEVADGAITVAVADGHGSAACFRSAVGAELAVNLAVDLLRDTCLEGTGRVPVELAARWREAVMEHAAAHPFTPAELALLKGPHSDPPFEIYGSTIMAVRATGSHILYLQIGDGDILIVDDSGDVTRPWPRDERFLGVETASLCGPAPEKDARVLVSELNGSAPALVLLATDGYANSFREDEGFLRTGADVLKLIRTEGAGYVEDHLEGWLNETSEKGSGDDITAALLIREVSRAS